MIPALPDGTTWLGSLGVVAGAVAFVAVAGPVGAVAGVLLLAAWLAVSDLAAYALGHVALGAIVAASMDPALGAGVEPLAAGLPAAPLARVGLVASALLPLLLGPLAATRFPVVRSALTLFVCGALAAVALAPVLAGEAVWVGSAALLAVAGLVAYAVHRYGLLVSGVLASG